MSSEFLSREDLLESLARSSKRQRENLEEPFSKIQKLNSSFFPLYYPPQSFFTPQQIFDHQTSLFQRIEIENRDLKMRMKILEEKNEKFKQTIYNLKKEISPENIVFLIDNFYTKPSFIYECSKTELKILRGVMLNKIKFYNNNKFHAVDETKLLGACKRLDILERELFSRP